MLCGSVVVPLDPSGHHPGSIRLNVQELPSLDAAKASTPPKLMFMIAGGPGQGSVEAFDLRDDAAFWRRLFPGYTLLAYDDRGTGSSGRLSCPGLAAVATASPAKSAAIVGRCGRSLGAKSSLYSTRTNTSDMDAIRQALGAGTISIFGVSYGTKQALGYALRYPSHVERLVLDSVVSPAWPGDVLQRRPRGIPKGLDQLCRAGCDGLTGTPGANFVKLANELAASPVVAEVPRPGARPTRVRLDGFALIELGLDTDLEPGLAVQLPADVSAALAGDPAPLERLVALDDQASGAGALGIDLAVNVATECSDGRFSGAGERGEHAGGPAAEGARKAPAGATGPFGSWAALGGAAQECVNWPQATAGLISAGRPVPERAGADSLRAAAMSAPRLPGHGSSRPGSRAASSS